MVAVNKPQRSSVPTLMSRPIAACGFAFGLLLSIGVLNGDDQGRVNLLYLLVVFMVVPVAGAGLSVFSLLTSKRLNAAQLLFSLPIWPSSVSNNLHKLHQGKLDKQWLFLQSQTAALAYSLATLLGFLSLLLVTDINFVWRSTLVDAEQLQGVLTVIAKPWFFWDAAQPSLELLRATQDSRLANDYSNVTQYGKWWPFILALLFVYAFLLRGMLYAVGIGAVFRASRVNSAKSNNFINATESKPALGKHKLAEITHQIPDDFAIANWAKFTGDNLASLPFSLGSCIEVGPELDEDELLALSEKHRNQLLVVKSWEPPMGELEDYMKQGQGLIMPVDMEGKNLTAPSKNHLQEWQRFTEKSTNWQVFQPAQWHAE